MEKQNEMLYEVGIQKLVLKNRVAVRLGVAVMPSEEFGTRVNPTPGIGFKMPI
jgi:hypothetical protein